MPKLDRYLFREFAQSFLATLIVLLVVSLGGVVVDLLGSIADGKLPPSLMISQLGLQLLCDMVLEQSAQTPAHQGNGQQHPGQRSRQQAQAQRARLHAGWPTAISR